MRERDIEAYLVKRVTAMGGEVRKVKWIGRRNAPDRVVMLPRRAYDNTSWVELKHPDTVHLFPMNAHERAQQREHERMRKAGQRVAVIGTLADVDNFLGSLI